MDRIINIKVFGNHMTKDNNKAGTRGEADATTLRIAFDDGWYEFEKEVIFWDAYGQNPVKRMITTDLLEEAAKSTSIYLVPIPTEAMARAGMLTFSIRGNLNKGDLIVARQVAITGTLEVDDSPDVIDEPIEITANELTQMQTEIESIKDGIQGMAEAKEALEGIADKAEKSATDAATSKRDAQMSASAASAKSESAKKAADRAEAAVGKTSYIGANGNWYAWDGEKGENGEFYDTGVKAQAGSEVYVGKNPPAGADVWIYPDGDEADITTEMIVNGAVTDKKIADGAVTEDKIANDSVTSDKIADEAVSLEKLSENALKRIDENKFDGVIRYGYDNLDKLPTPENRVQIYKIDDMSTTGVFNGILVVSGLWGTATDLSGKDVPVVVRVDQTRISTRGEVYSRYGLKDSGELVWTEWEFVGGSDINLENGLAQNSIQQPPETYSWGATNTRITEFLEKVGYKNSKGVSVQRDPKTGQFIVGAFGKNSAMFGAKGQTLGGKAINGGSKNLSLENNCFNFGNGTFAAGEHAGALNNETVALANSALAVNNGTTARGEYSFSSNEFTEANGKGSTSRGYKTKANANYSDASGVGGEANGVGSHKEGGNNISDGEYSHTENTENIASNVNTHSEGFMTIAGGEQSHSQNTRTIAGIRGFNITEWIDSGDIIVRLDSTKGLEAGDVVSIITEGVYLDCATIKRVSDGGVVFSTELVPIYDRGLVRDSSGNVIQNKLVNTLFIRKKPSLGTKVVGHHTHTEGYSTVASTDCQHVQGQYNIIDTEGKYLDIVGNGTDNEHRSNAYTLDKEGNGWFAGSVDVNAVIFRSSTSGSTKRFKLTIDDSKSLKVVEVNANGEEIADVPEIDFQ